ncbi:MAG: hypothetical protein IJP29_02840 [Lachnospiraceae bacterium]|nr:hypothetical protein [Lachnospiraceae bacterium]
MKAKKIMAVVGVAIVLAIIFLYVVFYLPIKDYIDKVPEITPKSRLTVEIGDTVEWADLFDVECKGEYTLKLAVQDQYYNVIEMSEDRQSFIVKGKADEVTIYVTARGENAEMVDSSNTITIE